MNAPDLGDLGSFPTQGAPRLFRKGPPGGSTNPRRRINAPDLVTGGRAAPSAQHAVVASRINHHRSPRHLSSCCRVQNSSRPLLGSSSSPQELLELISGLSSSLLLPWGPVLAQASLLALYFHQCNTLGCSLLRCGSCRKPGSRIPPQRCGSSSTGPPVNHADSGKTILKYFRRG